MEANRSTSQYIPKSFPDLPPLPAESTFFLTPLLILVNSLVFIWMVKSGVSPIDPKTRDLIAFGADFGPLTTHGEWWRMFTNMFVHIGFPHILMNMFVLYGIGKLTERLFGHFGFIVLYTLSGIGGSVASLFWHPQLVSAGASGAIFGLYGGLLAFIVLQKHTIPKATLNSLITSTGIFLVYNFVYGLLHQGTDVASHVGGLLAGFLIGLLLAQPALRVDVPSRLLRGAVALAVGAAGMALCAAGIPKIGKVMVGSKDEIYYFGTATNDDAVRLGDALKSARYFEDRGFEVELSKEPDERTVSFVVKDGAWTRPNSISAFELLARKIAPVVGGFPLKLRFLDTSRNVRKEMMVRNTGTRR
jgi:membrane associated rhomboid family serine protease